MNKETVSYDDLYKLLGENCFFGFTASRKENHVFYNFVSYRHPSTRIVVETIKTNPSVVPSPKIVSCITMNGSIMPNYETFIKEFNKVTKPYPRKKNKQKTE